MATQFILDGGDAAATPPWLGRNTAPPLDHGPIFEAALTAAGAAWSSSFATFSSIPAEMVFGGVATTRLDVLQQRRPGSIFAVLHATEWNTPIGLQFDRTFVSTMVDALFGGEDGEDAIEPATALSALELHIADVMAGQITDALAKGFAAHADAGLTYDRILARPETGFLGKPAAGVLVATLAVRVLGRTVHCDMLVPAIALAAMADRIAVASAETVAAIDPRWSRQLEVEIGRTAMDLRAALDGPAMSLGAVAALAPGQVLALPAGAGQRVTLSCGDAPLFRCDLGQSDGFYTLRIQAALAPAEELAVLRNPSDAFDQERPAAQ